MDSNAVPKGINKMFHFDLVYLKPIVGTHEYMYYSWPSITSLHSIIIYNHCFEGMQSYSDLNDQIYI